MKGLERASLPDRIIAIHLDHVVVKGDKLCLEKPQDEKTCSPHQSA